MMKVYLKHELDFSRYVKSFSQRGLHYVVIVSAGDRRRVVNAEELEQESQDLLLKLFSKSLDDYL